MNRIQNSNMTTFLFSSVLHVLPKIDFLGSIFGSSKMNFHGNILESA